MARRNSASKELHNWQDLYYDGEFDYFDESLVSSNMKEGINDCMEYIENEADYETLWLKHKALTENYIKKENIYIK